MFVGHCHCRRHSSMITEYDKKVTSYNTSPIHGFGCCFCLAFENGRHMANNDQHIITHMAQPGMSIVCSTLRVCFSNVILLISWFFIISFNINVLLSSLYFPSLSFVPPVFSFFHFILWNIILNRLKCS